MLNILIIATSVDERSMKEDQLINSMVSYFIKSKVKFYFNHSIDVSYDCVILLNYDYISIIQANEYIENVPVIFICFRSDSKLHYSIDDLKIKHTIIINDVDLKILNPHVFSSSQMSVPLPPHESVAVDAPTFDIYVSTSEYLYSDNALIKIIRSLNRLNKLSIIINTANAGLAKVLNRNITIINDNDIEKNVRKASLIIGSGYSIHFALKYNKPFIVVGEKGYGGILDKNDFVGQFNSFFQGTIGGRFDGPIPESLLLEDVDRVIKSNYSSDSDYRQLLSLLDNEIMTSFMMTIKQVISSNKYLLPEDLERGSLYFNNDYTLIKSANKYWLLNRFTRQILMLLEETHVEVINKINSETQYRPNETCLSIINDLLKSKILLYRAGN